MKQLAILNKKEFCIYDNAELADAVIGALCNYGDTHEDMHIAFVTAADLIEQAIPKDNSVSKTWIKEYVFEMLKDIVFESIEDNISHRWEFKNLSTTEFVLLVNEPLGALACTHQKFLGPKGSADSGNLH